MALSIIWRKSSGLPIKPAPAKSCGKSASTTCVPGGLALHSRASCCFNPSICKLACTQAYILCCKARYQTAARTRNATRGDADMKAPNPYLLIDCRPDHLAEGNLGITPALNRRHKNEDPRKNSRLPTRLG